MKRKAVILILVGLAIAALLLGATIVGYLDLSLISAPGNPSAGYLRLWSDSGSTTIKCKTSSGTACYFTAAAGSALQIQTNNVDNASQAILDLVAGSGITLNNTSGGTVSIASSGSGVTFQTNGVSNGSQTLLNLAAGSGVTLTDNGSGQITIASTGGACGTCLTGTPTTHGVAIGGSGQAVSFTATGTAHQYLGSGGSSADGAYQDHPDVWMIPFANCVSGTAGSGPNTASSNFTPACRAGSNNLGGADQAIPSTGASLQFQLDLPGDWDTASQPYINVYYGSGSNTSGTVIWTASTACVDVSTPGGTSDDPGFHAESAFSTQTMAAASRMWIIGGQFTAVTSANGCKAKSPMIIKLAVSGTAASNINAYYATVTIPRTPTVQAN